MAHEPKVFVSYARVDGEAFALSIHEQLRACGVSTWFDRQGMVGGQDWWRQIVDALDDASYLVLITTPSAIRRPVVQAEWKRARRRGVCVVPVSVPGLPLDFDAMPRWMRRLKFYDPTREWDALVAQLRSTPSPARAPHMAPELARHITRGLETEAAIRLLLDGEKEPLPARVALRGPPGFGKSTLAAAVCASEDVQWAFDDGILWVELGPEPDVADVIRRLYPALAGAPAVFRTVHEAAEALREWLEERHCLIVIDDVWRSSDLVPFLAGGTRCARLITTRQLDVAVEVDARVVEVAEMTSDEAVRLLARDLECIPGDREALVLVARRLGEWPLLLVLANAAIRQRIHHAGTTARALEWIGAALDRHGPAVFDRRDAAGRNAAVARSLDVSFQFLSDLERDRFLELAIFPPAVSIPLSAARALWGIGDFDAEDIMRRLADLSLVRLDLSAGAFTIHQAIRDYCARLLGDPTSVHRRLAEGWGAPHDLPDDYAWRWYGWHLVQAGRADEMRRHMLSFDWIRRKAERVGVDALLDDYARLPDEDVLTPIRRAVELSRDAEARHPGQMAVQLSARLHRERAPAVMALRDDARRATPLVLLTYPLDVPGGRLVRRMVLPRAVNAMVVDDRSIRLITGHDDGFVAVRSLDSGLPIQWLNHSTGEATSLEPALPAASTFDKRWRRRISALLVVRDRRWLVSGAGDGSIQVWDLKTLRLRSSVASTVRTAVTSLAAPANGSYLVAGYKSGAVVVYEENRGETLATLREHDRESEWVQVAVHPDGHTVLASLSDGTLCEWSADGWSPKGTIEGEIFAMGLLVVEPEWCHAVTADRRIAFFDLETGERTYELGLRDYEHFRSIALTPDGMHVLVGAEYGYLAMYTTHFGELVFDHYDAGHRFDALAVLPDGRTAVSASGGTLQLWDIRPEEVEEIPVPTLHAHQIWDVATNEADAVAVSISQGYLVTWAFYRDRDGALHVEPDGQVFPINVWRHLEQRWTMHVLPGAWRAVSMYLCGSIIVGLWTQLTVWDRSTREFRLLLRGEEREVLSRLRISADGRFCWATKEDETLMGWNLDSGQVLEPTALTSIIEAEGAEEAHRRWGGQPAEYELGGGMTLDRVGRTVTLTDVRGRLLHTYTADYDITRLRVLRVDGIPAIIMGDAGGRVHIIDLKHVL